MLHLRSLALSCLLFNISVHTVPPGLRIPKFDERAIYLFRIKKALVKHHHKILKDKRIRASGKPGLTPIQLLHLARVYNHAILFEDLRLHCPLVINEILREINVMPDQAFTSERDYELSAAFAQDFEQKLIKNYQYFARYVRKNSTVPEEFYHDLYGHINAIPDERTRAYLFDQINKIRPIHN